MTLLVAMGVTSVVWRRKWRKYRAAYRAETERAVNEAKGDLEALSRDLK